MRNINPPARHYLDVAVGVVYSEEGESYTRASALLHRSQNLKRSGPTQDPVLKPNGG